MSLNYEQRCELVKKIQIGDVWVNRKTAKRAQVVSIRGTDLELQHESGRVTWKQDHYFASDFEPSSSVC